MSSPTSQKAAVELPPLHSLNIPKIRRESQGNNQYHMSPGAEHNYHTPLLTQHQFFQTPSSSFSEHTMPISFPSPISPRDSISEAGSRNGSFSGASTSSSCRIEKAYAQPMHHHHHHHQLTRLDKHEKRRRNHLESEKRRRENIKSGMDGLLSLVPKCQDKGLSKAVILNETRDYLMLLQDELQATERELQQERLKVQDLLYQNENLRKGQGSSLSLGGMSLGLQTLMRV